MNRLSSMPRPLLVGLSPLAMLEAVMPEEAGALMDALGIREVPYGELDLAPRALDRTRVERGPPPICQRPEADNRIDLRRPVRMNPGSVWAGMAEPYSQAHPNAPRKGRLPANPQTARHPPQP